MNFSNTYINLGARFYEESLPTAAPNPQLFLWNSKLADQLNIPAQLQGDCGALAEVFSGNRLFEGAKPVATAYAGHQFGNFNPQLGDGRAHLLGEAVDQAGQRWDIQLKGSGPTPFSRGGDGRCGIGPAIREFIMSEAMQALGVPTTRCLAVVTTGEEIYRETAVPGAVVTRIASSHLRVGTFQFFAARSDLDAIKILSDFAIERHFPELNNETDNRYLTLLEKVMDKQINLIIEWLRVGFIHGVMNTDNTAISGETIDFGPCAMLGIYEPKTAYSSIDQMGRYAFGNQPTIAHWNLARFAECLLMLSDKEDTNTFSQVESLINEFPARFKQAYLAMMAKKLGLQTIREEDENLIGDLMHQLQTQKLDYTIIFNQLTKSLGSEDINDELHQQLKEPFAQWRSRLTGQEMSLEKAQSLMRNNNPVVIPRNHHMEKVLADCQSSGDSKPAELFLDVLHNPYEDTPNSLPYQAPPVDNDQQYQTFCGT
ncbi:MAG: YdiU family protein [Pseudomonadota bacterium]